MNRHVFTPEEDASGIVTGFQGDTGFDTAVQSQADKTYWLFKCALKDCMRIHKHLRLRRVLVEYKYSGVFSGQNMPITGLITSIPVAGRLVENDWVTGHSSA